MRRIRVIPALLLKNEGLYKTLKFKEPKYVGDPVNTVKILNEKEADELLILDITASNENKRPSFEKITEIASEAFVPVGYGGGITSLDDIKRILNSGIEKVVLNTSAAENPRLVADAANMFGSQSVVVSIDVKKNIFAKYRVYIKGGRKKTVLDVIDWARRVEELGAGEILINSIDRDGTFSGYDINLIKSVTSSVTIPVVACGGASSIEDFEQAVNVGGASAVAAGSLFVFQKTRTGILISFPSESELIDRFYNRINANG